MKAVVSIYRTGEGKPIERYKARVQIGEDHKYTASLKSILIDLLGGFNDQTKNFGWGVFDLKLYRLTKLNGKAENYAILTQQQLDVELPFLFGSEGKAS